MWRMEEQEENYKQILSARVESTNRVRGWMWRFERVFFVSLFEWAEASERHPRLLGRVHSCIGVYCHKVLAVEKLSFAPVAIRDQLKLCRVAGKVLQTLPILLQLCARFATLSPASDVDDLACRARAFQSPMHL